MSQPSPEPQAGDPMPFYQDRDTAGTATARNSQAAIGAFILGVFSVAGMPIMGPVAIVVAGRALRDIDSGRVPPAGRGLAVAGRVLGIVGTVLLVLVVVAVVVGLVWLTARAGSAGR